MKPDPIIEETRRRREEYAQEHGNDLNAIFEDILKRQAASRRRQVTLPPRKPQPWSGVA